MHKFVYADCEFTLFHPEKAGKGCDILSSGKKFLVLESVWGGLLRIGIAHCFYRARRDLMIPHAGRKISKKLFTTD